MKKNLFIVLFLALPCLLKAQDLSKFKLYKPEENAETAISEAMKEAKENKKHIFIQVGGNWCIWCARFNDFITKDRSIDSMVHKNFVIYHLNYSKENYNKSFLAKYRFPQRFGFPVFLVLDAKGNLLHTQNSAYLEEGKGYSKAKVMEFFSHWSPEALDPLNYKEKEK